MAKHVYLIRHGQSDSNATDVYHGKEAGLTEQGRVEAVTIAERIERIKPGALLTSTYRRAVDTAMPASKRLGLTIEQSEVLIEFRQPSILVGKSRSEFPELEVIRKSVLNKFGIEPYRHSDEETFEEFRERSLKALDLFDAHPAERLAVVTHGMFMRGILCAAVYGSLYTGHELNHAWRFAVSNTGISHLRKYPDDNWQTGWEILSWNDSAHLG